LIDKNPMPSVLIRYAGTLWFILMALGALVWFSISAFDLAQQLLTLPAVITLNKGTLYLFGVGIGLGALCIAAVFQFWLEQPLSDRFSKIITAGAVSGLLITFILPHAVHYPVASYLEKHGYQVCPAASHQWLHSRRIVFVNDQSICIQPMQNRQR